MTGFMIDLTPKIPLHSVEKVVEERLRVFLRSSPEYGGKAGAEVWIKRVYTLFCGGISTTVNQR
jgi:hypothetical protein